MIVCFVVIIINHRNRLFSSPVFQNVRNFSDVIQKYLLTVKGLAAFQELQH